MDRIYTKTELLNQVEKLKTFTDDKIGSAWMCSLGIFNMMGPFCPTMIKGRVNGEYSECTADGDLSLIYNKKFLDEVRKSPIPSTAETDYNTHDELGALLRPHLDEFVRLRLLYQKSIK